MITIEIRKIFFHFYSFTRTHCTNNWIVCLFLYFSIRPHSHFLTFIHNLLFILICVLLSASVGEFEIIREKNGSVISQRINKNWIKNSKRRTNELKNTGEYCEKPTTEIHYVGEVLLESFFHWLGKKSLSVFCSMIFFYHFSLYTVYFVMMLKSGFFLGHFSIACHINTLKTFFPN